MIIVTGLCFEGSISTMSHTPAPPYRYMESKDGIKKNQRNTIAIGN